MLDPVHPLNPKLAVLVLDLVLLLLSLPGLGEDRYMSFIQMEETMFISLFLKVERMWWSYLLIIRIQE
jgi:hypothetical protein